MRLSMTVLSLIMLLNFPLYTKADTVVERRMKQITNPIMERSFKSVMAVGEPMNAETIRRENEIGLVVDAQASKYVACYEATLVYQKIRVLYNNFYFSVSKAGAFENVSSDLQPRMELSPYTQQLQLCMYNAIKNLRAPPSATPMVFRFEVMFSMGR